MPARLTSGSAREAPLAAQHRLFCGHGHVLLRRAHKKHRHLLFNPRHGEGEFGERREVSQNVTFSHGFALVPGLQDRLAEPCRSSSSLGRAALAALSGRSSPSCPSAPHTFHTRALWHSACAPLSGFTVFSSSTSTE